ncbi:hypothetical protein D3C72_1924710 [compost metagenome]
MGIERSNILEHQRKRLFGQLIQAHRPFGAEPGVGPAQGSGEETSQDEWVGLEIPRRPGLAQHVQPQLLIGVAQAENKLLAGLRQ